MKRKVPDYKKILTPSDLELNTCSNQDCTGLIPTAVKNPAEADSYEELYPYITVVSPTLQDNPNKINADTKKKKPIIKYKKQSILTYNPVNRN